MIKCNFEKIEPEYCPFCNAHCTSEYVGNVLQDIYDREVGELKYLGDHGTMAPNNLSKVVNFAKAAKEFGFRVTMENHIYSDLLIIECPKCGKIAKFNYPQYRKNRAVWMGW